MTGYFVADDDRGRILWRGTPEDQTLEWIAVRDGFLDSAVFDAAAAVLAPDDALIERVAGRCEFKPAIVRAVLAAVREEAGR